MILEPIVTFIPSTIGIDFAPFDNIVTTISEPMILVESKINSETRDVYITIMILK